MAETGEVNFPEFLEQAKVLAEESRAMRVGLGLLRQELAELRKAIESSAEMIANALDRGGHRHRL